MLWGGGVLLAQIGPNAFSGATALVVGPLGPRPPYCGGLEIAHRSPTVGRTALNGRSASRRELYPTTHNIPNRRTSISPDGTRTHDPSNQAAADLRLRPRGHRDRPSITMISH